MISWLKQQRRQRNIASLMNEEEYLRVLSHFTIGKAKVNSVEIPSVGRMKNVACPPTQGT